MKYLCVGNVLKKQRNYNMKNNISLQSRKDSTKGQIIDYAWRVAQNNEITVEELILILKEISEQIK